MNIKSAVIKTNDVLAYMAFILVALFAAGAAMTGNIPLALMIACVGWLTASLIFGFWMVMSNISANSDRQTELMQTQVMLLEKQNIGIKKIYYEMQANSNNEFVMNDLKD